MCVYTHTYTHTHIHTYVHTYTHTHTHFFPSAHAHMRTQLADTAAPAQAEEEDVDSAPDGDDESFSELVEYVGKPAVILVRGVGSEGGWESEGR